MPRSNAAVAAICWTTVTTLAAFLCLTQLGMMLGLFSGGPVLGWIAPIGFVGAFAIANELARRMAGAPASDRVWSAVIAVGTLGVALAVSAWYFDFSWDGEWYHQTAVYAIARGWNPLTDPMRGFLSHLELWVRHYAKGPWYVAAAIYDTTGQIELGKCTAILALVASGLAVFAAALEANLRRHHAAALALLVALNSVVSSELTTYLVDGIMYGFLVVAVAAMFSALRQPRPLVLVAGGLAAIVAINAKFTGLVFLCFAFAAGGLWCAARRRDWLLHYTGWTALALCLGTFVWGYNPYVTNTIHRHQPFYPVLGSAAFPSLTKQGKEGIIRSETPKNFLAHNRLMRLGYATFGRPGNAPYGGIRNASLMWPFAAQPTDLFFYKYHETRVAGFGPWFSGLFLLSFGLGVWLLFQASPHRWAAVLSVGAIASSLLISPHLWWPRYGPQYWLLPIVPLAFVFALGTSRRAMAVAWGLAGLLFVNALIVAAVRMDWETRATVTLRHQLTELRDAGREIDVSLRYFEIPYGERLKAWGIRFVPKGRNEIRDGIELKSVVDRYPAAVTYRVPAVPTQRPTN